MGKKYYTLSTSPPTHPARNPRRPASPALRQRRLYGKSPRNNTGKESDSETGLYYYGARYLDPKTSRWISGDPALGEYVPSAPVSDEARKRNGNLPGMGGVFNYVNLHVYHYAGNNPVKYTDPDGRIPGRPCDTADKAAIDVLNYINPISIDENIEYSGFIYQDNDGKYYATYPEPGQEHRATLDPSKIPDGAKIVGDYHTHGDYSAVGQNGQIVRVPSPYLDEFNSDNFSDYPLTGDKQTLLGRSLVYGGDDYFDYIGYLGTPSGNFLKYNPWTGEPPIRIE